MKITKSRLREIIKEELQKFNELGESTKSTRLTDIMSEDIDFRTLAKSNNFDIIVPEGRFEIENVDGKPKFIIVGQTRIPVGRNDIYNKYKKEIDKFAKENSI